MSVVRGIGMVFRDCGLGTLELVGNTDRKLEVRGCAIRGGGGTLKIDCIRSSWDLWV